jgi:hypothetical protein
MTAVAANTLRRPSAFRVLVMRGARMAKRTLPAV